MLLSKVSTFRPFLLWKTYSSWLVFCICILILTNGFSSLTLIREYRFPVIDTLLTFGLLVFWGVLEAMIIAAFLVVIEVILEKSFKRRLDLLFRVILIAGLTATWVILLRTVLRYFFL